MNYLLKHLIVLDHIDFYIDKKFCPEVFQLKIFAFFFLNLRITSLNLTNVADWQSGAHEALVFYLDKNIKYKYNNAFIFKQISRLVIDFVNSYSSC